MILVLVLALVLVVWVVLLAAEVVVDSVRKGHDVEC